LSVLVAPTLKVADWPTVLFTPVGWKAIVGATAGELVVAMVFSDSPEFRSETLAMAVTLT
jgi:hypothetical protein